MFRYWLRLYGWGWAYMDGRDVGRVEALTLTLSQRERELKVIDRSGAFAPFVFQASGWGRPRGG